jgi:hypothetical protein
MPTRSHQRLQGEFEGPPHGLTPNGRSLWVEGFFYYSSSTPYGKGSQLGGWSQW